MAAAQLRRLFISGRVVSRGDSQAPQNLPNPKLGTKRKLPQRIPRRELGVLGASHRGGHKCKCASASSAVRDYGQIPGEFVEAKNLRGHPFRTTAKAFH